MSQVLLARPLRFKPLGKNVLESLGESGDSASSSEQFQEAPQAWKHYAAGVSALQHVADEIVFQQCGDRQPFIFPEKEYSCMRWWTDSVVPATQPLSNYQELVSRHLMNCRGFCLPFRCPQAAHECSMFSKPQILLLGLRTLSGLPDCSVVALIAWHCMFLWRPDAVPTKWDDGGVYDPYNNDKA